MKRPERWRGDCEGYSSEEMLEWIEYAEYLESILKEWYKDVIKNTPDDADWWDNVEDRLACKIIRWIQNEVK